MKTKLAQIVTVFLFCLLAAGARATVLFQDSFNYPNGTLSNLVWVPGAGSTLNNAILATNGNSALIRGASASDLARAYFTNGPGGSITAPSAPNFPNTVYLFPTNDASVSSIYYSFTVNAQTLPQNNGIYFAYMTDTNFNFRACVEITTNHAATGSYRLGILSKSSDAFVQTNNILQATNVIQQDLSVGQNYFVLVRYTINSGVCTLWINPTNVASTATNVVANSGPTNNAVIFGYYDQAGTTNTAAAAIGLRATSTSTMGNLQISNLWVTTSYAEAVPSSPQITIQPQDNASLFAGGSFQLQTLGVANSAVSYQWYYATNNVTNTLSDSATIIGSMSNILSFSSIITNESGNYFCAISTSAGTNVSRAAVITINPQPVPPTITSQPVNTTNNVGDTIVLSVAATGIPAPAYQWFVVTNGVTNAVVGSIYSGTNTTTLTISPATTTLSGLFYFATVTNSAPGGKTNSALAEVVVNPVQTLTVAQFRAKVDNNFAPTNTTTIYTLTGTVTTWTNMTSSTTSTEFYMQDNSGGIAVFWSGAAPSTNLPPAGTQVQVTGSMSAFNGLLEIESIFGNSLNGIVVLSTNNPLPQAQPLPFDPNVSLYPATAKNATMDKLESMYLVASNVMLNLSTPTFVSGANDSITNNAMHVLSATNSVVTINFTNQAGQQFVLFVNANSGLPGKTKYTGPVTIYGVLGYFTSAGYEFTPSRFEDIISYSHVTNIVTNVKRYGDLLTNSYTENVLRSGETMTSYINIGDPEGGIVTLTPSNAGLPTGAHWDGVTNGSIATAVFHYTGMNVDDGNNFTMNVGVSSTSGSSSTYSFTVYVPTADEQKVAITEFLANPTTNTLAPNFNPLHRSSGTSGAKTNDEYIELVNQGSSSIDTTSGNGWEMDSGNTANPIITFDGLNNPPVISSSNAIVIYGGGSPTPNLTVNSYDASQAGALALPTGGTGIIILRNGNGNIVDRVVYSANDLNTNGSLTRFPTANSVFVPQPYVSTNLNTAGLQYDGSAWNHPYKIPSGVNNVGISVTTSGQVIFNFNANTAQADTLWGATTVNGPFSVLFGRQFSNTSGSFTNSVNEPVQFYYISTQ